MPDASLSRPVALDLVVKKYRTIETPVSSRKCGAFPGGGLSCGPTLSTPLIDRERVSGYERWMAVSCAGLIARWVSEHLRIARGTRQRTTTSIVCDAAPMG